MSPPDGRGRERLRMAVVSARAVLTAAVLIALYYALPLDADASAASMVIRLTLGVIVFAAVMTWQLRAIAQSKNPALRALEGLFLILPLFLLVFASTYFVMSRSDPEVFTAPLSRTDALYFTVTVFSTVGFGDISAKAEGARLVVTAQMVLDLVVLGLGVRVIASAVQRGRDRLTSGSDDDLSSP